MQSSLPRSTRAVLIRALHAISLIIFMAAALKTESAEAQTRNDSVNTSTSRSRQIVEIARGVTYEQIDIDDKAHAHVVTVDTTCGAVAIKPYMSDSIETTSSAAAKNNAIVAINAGFFNLSDGESTSYITIDGKQLCEPKHNAALVNNEGLKPFLAKIFNRSELRFLVDKNGKTQMRVQAHSDAAPAGFRIVDSIQAGPQLLPKYTAKEEAFVRRPPGAAKDADSIGTNMRAARTAFGITQGGKAVLVCVEGRKTKEFAEGISLPNLAQFMRRLGCESAINFDGGTSTTMVLNITPEIARDIFISNKTQSCDPLSTNAGQSRAAQSNRELVTVVASSPERRVKSVIYVTPAK